jgi:hypothetical protein
MLKLFSNCFILFLLCSISFAQASSFNDTLSALELQASSNYNYYKTVRSLSEENDPVIAEYLEDHYRMTVAYINDRKFDFEMGLRFHQKFDLFNREIFENSTQRLEILWGTYALLFKQLNEYLTQHPEINPESDPKIQQLISILLGEVARSTYGVTAALAETTQSLVSARFKHIIRFEIRGDQLDMSYSEKKIKNLEDECAILICHSIINIQMEITKNPKSKPYLNLLSSQFTEAYSKLFKDSFPYKREFYELVEHVHFYKTLESLLKLEYPIEDDVKINLGAAKNHLLDQIHNTVKDRLKLYFFKKLGSRKKSTSENAKYVLDINEATKLMESSSSNFLKEIAERPKKITKKKTNQRESILVNQEEPSSSKLERQVDGELEHMPIELPKEKEETASAEIPSASTYLTEIAPEDSYLVFDLQEWLAAETAKSTKALPAEQSQTKSQSSPKIRLIKSAARTYLSGQKFNAFQIQNRDFVEFLNQIGGGLVKNKGNGSEVKYFLPNFKSDRIQKPFKVFRIDFSHNGKTPINAVALWKFFGSALEETGLSDQDLELEP